MLTYAVCGHAPYVDIRLMLTGGYRAPEDQCGEQDPGGRGSSEAGRKGSSSEGGQEAGRTPRGGARLLPVGVPHLPPGLRPCRRRAPRVGISSTVFGVRA